MACTVNQTSANSITEAPANDSIPDDGTGQSQTALGQAFH